MRVIDILNKANKEKMIKNLLELHDTIFKDIDKTRNILNIFFTDINSIQLEKQDVNFLILITKYYDENYYKNENIFDVASKYIKNNKEFDFDTVTEKDLETYYCVDGIYLNDLKNTEKLLSLSFNEFKKLPTNNDFITIYGIEFTPRSKILAFNVANYSIEKYGIDLCATEIFYEMTFYGLTDKQIKEKEEEIFNKREDEYITVNKLEELLDDKESETFQINQQEIDFSIKFDYKIREFNYNLRNQFLKKVLETEN